VQRCRQDWSIADALKSETIIVAHGQTDGGVHRDRNSAIPAAGIAIYQITVAHDAHREDAVFVKTAESAERNYRPVGHANYVAQVLLHVDESDMAQIFPIAFVHRTGGEIDTHESVEDQSLRRLGELNAIVRQLVLRRIEYFAEFMPSQVKTTF